jgi:hypothetical protein
VFFISFGITSALIPYEEIPKKAETQEEKNLRIMRGDFKDEQERKEYFDEQERRWGNH